MILVIIAFFIDVLMFWRESCWVGMLTQTCYCAALLQEKKLYTALTALCCLVVRDAYAYSIPGVTLCWLVPVTIFAYTIDYFFKLPWFSYLALLTLVSYYAEQIVIKKIVFGALISPFISFFGIILNLFFIIGYSIYLDTRGNHML